MMTPQLATVAPSEGIGGLSFGVVPAALDLLDQLQTIPLSGPEMFERDCLSLSFASWQLLSEGRPIPEMDCVSAEDVFNDIADIRALPRTYPNEVNSVAADLLEIAALIESHVRSFTPTLQ